MTLSVPLSVGTGVTLQADPGLAEPCADWALEVTVVAGIEAAKWRRSLADCAWWRRHSSSEDDANRVSVRQCCLCRAVAINWICGMLHYFRPNLTVSL